jgi:glycerol-3-phosphate dehydrogenase subunit C
MREGSLEAPIRHKVDWQNPEFTDLTQLDAEMRRVFDICHGCRRCFNLCDSFPKLFELVDDSKTGELDSVDSKDFKAVVDSCTLCDMCYLTKCPYVPPHEFNLDFPHLMLRYRYAERAHGTQSFVNEQLSEMDRNANLAKPIAPLVNWTTKTDNALTRPLLEKVAHIDRRAAVPKFNSKTLVQQSKAPLQLNETAAAFGEKVAIYATCFGNYHNPDLGLATRYVLAQNGIDAQVVYPGCCGMPKLEQGDIPSVVKQAETVAQELIQWVDQGYTIMALVPSCALMLKQEWPLLTDHPAVHKLASHTVDVAEYLVKIAKSYGLAEGIQSLGEKVTVHISCHSRAQNMGQKAVEMLKLIPDLEVTMIERCSGHGGSWGMMVDHFDIALKVGKPVAKAALTHNNRRVLSECPLAGEHILQGMEHLGAQPGQFSTDHPIYIMAQAYGWQGTAK